MWVCGQSGPHGPPLGDSEVRRARSRKVEQRGDKRENLCGGRKEALWGAFSNGAGSRQGWLLSR
jgi:hypothetical protein